MKICPQCAFANEERFPACLLWCNELLVNVCSTPAADPDHPEHIRNQRDRRRYASRRRQLAFAVLCYVLLTTLLAVLPGMMIDPGRLGLHFAAGLVVAMAVVRGIAGQFTGMFLHGALSTALVYFYGPVHVFIFFMILGHILLPNVFWHWVDLIDGALR